MKISSLLGFLFFYCPSLSLNIDNYFKVMLNMFRSDPIGYKHFFDVDVKCTRPLDVQYDLLHHNDYLDKSSYFQSNTLSFNNCSVIGNSTCDLYCHLFNHDCSVESRMKSFLPAGSTSMMEMIIKGPKQIRTIFNLFLNSPNHCDVLLDPKINSVGCSLQHHDKNIFVSNFANIPTSKVNNSFIFGYYNNLNNLTSFYVNTFDSLEVYVIINNHVSYRMNPYFNSYFFGLRLNYSVPSKTSFYFTDLNYNSSTYFIE